MEWMRDLPTVEEEKEGRLWGGVNRELQDEPTHRELSPGSHEQIEDLEINFFQAHSMPCALRLPGIPIWRPMFWTLASPQAPVPRQWGQWLNEIFIFYPCYCKQSNFPLFFSSFPLFGTCIIACKVNLFLLTNAVFACFFNCIFSPTIIFNFFLVSFPSANKCASLFYLCISEKFS